MLVSNRYAEFPDNLYNQSMFDSVADIEYSDSSWNESNSHTSEFTIITILMLQHFNKCYTQCPQITCISYST